MEGKPLSHQWHVSALTVGPAGPVDGSVPTQRPERLAQRGHAHLTARHHAQELRPPLRLVPRQLDVSLQGQCCRSDVHTNKGLQNRNQNQQESC